MNENESDHSNDAVYWARIAVREAEKAAKYAKRATILYTFSTAFMLIAIIAQIAAK